MNVALSRILITGLAAVAMLGAVAAAPDKAAIGQFSPDFSLTDSNGHKTTLSDYRGKFVVLECTNKDCQFVRKHYNSVNMQSTQEQAEKMGAVWFTVISSAPGLQGYMTPSEVNAYRTENNVKSEATLMDPSGTVGHIYSARTTPQIVIIDPKGVVLFDGGIDDRPSPDPDSLKGARNYALEALKDAMSGKPIEVDNPRPYGCSVKYADE